MADAKFWVSYGLNPVRLSGRGLTYEPADENPAAMLGREPEAWRWITEEQFYQLSGTSEPSKLIADWLGLPYQKYLAPDPGSQVNVVEIIADGDCAWDQPCRFGHRVEDYAVYCHNSRWIDSPRKCRRTAGSQWRQPWPHEECPGFEPNPRLHEIARLPASPPPAQPPTPNRSDATEAD